MSSGGFWRNEGGSSPDLLSRQNAGGCLRFRVRLLLLRSASRWLHHNLLWEVYFWICRSLLRSNWLAQTRDGQLTAKQPVLNALFLVVSFRLLREEELTPRHHLQSRVGPRKRELLRRLLEEPSTEALAAEPEEIWEVLKSLSLAP